jgi:hypothetical protein
MSFDMSGAPGANGCVGTRQSPARTTGRFARALDGFDIGLRRRDGGERQILQLAMSFQVRLSFAGSWSDGLTASSRVIAVRREPLITPARW